MKVVIILFAPLLVVPRFEVEPLGPPLAVLLLVELRIPPRVGSPEQWPLVLELAKIISLDDQASSLDGWF